MDFLALSLRVAAAGPVDYLPYAFEGDWLEEDRALVESALRPHVPAAVDSMFNNWRLWHWGGDLYSASRATWDMGGLNAMSATELATLIAEYYQEPIP